MPFIVTAKCVKCRYSDCVEVCPVDAFYEGENMLVINPDECIDCGVCEPECPIEAIKSDEELTSDEQVWVEKNEKFSAIWPNITVSKGPLAGADDWSEKTNEEKTPLFSEKPGEG